MYLSSEDEDGAVASRALQSRVSQLQGEAKGRRAQLLKGLSPQARKCMRSSNLQSTSDNKEFELKESLARQVQLTRKLQQQLAEHERKEQPKAQPRDLQGELAELRKEVSQLKEKLEQKNCSKEQKRKRRAESAMAIAPLQQQQVSRQQVSKLLELISGSPQKRKEVVFLEQVPRTKKKYCCCQYKPQGNPTRVETLNCLARFCEERRVRVPRSALESVAEQLEQAFRGRREKGRRG